MPAKATASAPSTSTTGPRTPAAAPAVLPDIARLQEQLTSAFANAGPDSGALVYDLTDNQTLFSLRANVGRPPASVEKLYTTVTLLSELGPDARLTTTVLGLSLIHI